MGSATIRRRAAWAGGIIVAGLTLVLLVLAALAGFLDRDAVHVYAARGPARAVAVLYLPGDMGLRFGPGPDTIDGLATQGLDVVVLNSPTLFRQRRTRAEVDHVIATGVADALARTGAARIVLIGQSYGADIVQTGAADLPPALRRRVAGIVLVVPGRTVFFRADPTSLAYRGAPDSLAAATLPRIDWAPLTCIYGIQEHDSACPLLHQPNATRIAMPGGHFLLSDHAGLLAHIMAAIRQAAAGAFR